MTIRRSLVAKIAANALGLERQSQENHFVDTTDDYTQALYEAGIVNGYKDGTYLPDRTLTRAELSAIRLQGYAMDNEECDIGTRCVAAPVRDYTGRIIAGISVTAPSLRLTPERSAQFLPLIFQTVDALSRKLAYQGHEV